MKSRVAVICALGLWGCGAPDGSERTPGAELGVEASALGNKDFDVDFSGCAEFAGIGVVPAANARPLVPAHYTLQGNENDAFMVVRVARCASAIVDGKAQGATTTSQIGISVAGQDGTADINNYTLFYATDQPLLHARLQSAGLDSDNTNGISITLSGTALSVASSSPHTPTFGVSGSVPGPFFPPDEFIASWWADGSNGVFRARTVFPAIQFSLSTVTLTTPAGSALAELIGATTFTFAALDSYNTFTSSHLEVRDTD
jgi:hypothetical protein